MRPPIWHAPPSLCPRRDTAHTPIFPRHSQHLPDLLPLLSPGNTAAAAAPTGNFKKKKTPDTRTPSAHIQSKGLGKNSSPACPPARSPHPPSLIPSSYVDTRSRAGRTAHICANKASIQTEPSPFPLSLRRFLRPALFGLPFLLFVGLFFALRVFSCV